MDNSDVIGQYAMVAFVFLIAIAASIWLGRLVAGQMNYSGKGGDAPSSLQKFYRGLICILFLPPINLMFIAFGCLPGLAIMRCFYNSTSFDVTIYTISLGTILLVTIISFVVYLKRGYWNTDLYYGD